MKGPGFSDVAESSLAHGSSALDAQWLPANSPPAGRCSVSVRAACGIWSAIIASPLSNSTPSAAAHRVEYGGIEYGELPLKVSVLHCRPTAVLGTRTRTRQIETSTSALRLDGIRLRPPLGLRRSDLDAATHVRKRIRARQQISTGRHASRTMCSQRQGLCVVRRHSQQLPGTVIAPPRPVLRIDYPGKTRWKGGDQ